MPFNQTGTREDTRLWKWKKILGLFQNAAGADAANNPKREDTLYRTILKVLRAQTAQSGPAVPTSVSSQAVFVQSYQINWTNGSPIQTAVEVWLKVGGGAYYLAATVGPAVTTYTDGGPWGGSTICGKVRSRNGALLSAFSGESCVVYP